MSTIDLEHAKKQFREYLSAYDQTDEKIRLKCRHTFCVVEAADYLCKQEKLPEQERKLALLIALLHDIGRFEQLRVFHSYDDRKMNHAVFGVQLLFEEGKIRSFIETDEYDEIIRCAILHHADYQLQPMEDKRSLLHCRLIRDADKLDNFRVKATESLEAHFDLPKEVVERETISPKVLQAIRREESVLREDRTTHLDMWVSYLAFLFDLNFSSSFRYLQEHDYVKHNIGRMDYQDVKTREEMKEIEEICQKYVEKHSKVQAEFV